MKNNEHKSFIWYGLRIAFWSMILVTSLLAISNFLGDRQLKYYGLDILLWLYKLSELWYISTISTLILSIIHLKKFNEKVFAVIALGISSVQILLALWSWYIYPMIVI